MSSSGQGSQGSAGSKQGWSGSSYEVTGSGTNSQGNHYCNRDYGSGSGSAYHYSNNNGSYYYQNPDGSKYYNDGQGFAKFDRAEKK